MSMNDSRRSKMKILFINTYALMSKGRPYAEYEHYVAMDQVKGLDVGTLYLNRKMAMEFSVAIAQTEVSELRAKFKKGKFFSLVLDEATDVYCLEQCIAYIRFSERGDIFTKFLGIKSVVRCPSVFGHPVIAPPPPPPHGNIR